MEDTNAQNVNVIIADPDRRVRQEFKNVLFCQGFREINGTDEMSVVCEAIAGNRADRLICNAEFTDRHAWQVNGQIRHHAIGNNPFVVIITHYCPVNRRIDSIGYATPSRAVCIRCP